MYEIDFEKKTLLEFLQVLDMITGKNIFFLQKMPFNDKFDKRIFKYKEELKKVAETINNFKLQE